MAEKRMFSLSVIDTDWFLDLPLSTQALYFHLNMRADDDGFVDSPRSIIRKIQATANDYQLLLAKRFILEFDSGVIVIKHWRMHNTIQKDRYHATKFKEEMNQLEIKTNKSYTEKKSGNTLDTKCVQSIISNPISNTLSNINNNSNINYNNTMYNNNSNNNKEDNNDIITKKPNKTDKKENIVKDIIEYLNLKANKKFKATNKETVRHINARISEGFTFEDFKIVIDKKVDEWKNTTMDEYIRPLTLFGTKFESYLNSNTTSKEVNRKKPNFNNVVEDETFI